jgi:hypothetical protein
MILRRFIPRWRSSRAIVPNGRSCQGVSRRSRPCRPSDLSQILLLEQLAKFGRVLTGDHEHAVAAVVDRLRIFRADGDVGLHDLQNKKAVFGDLPRIDDFAFEIRKAFLDQRRFDFLTLSAVRSKRANFSTSRPDVLPTPTTLVARSAVGMLITHSRLLRIISKLWF